MPSLLCTGTVRTSFPCTQISYAAQEHLQVRPLSLLLTPQTPIGANDICPLRVHMRDDSCHAGVARATDHNQGIEGTYLPRAGQRGRAVSCEPAEPCPCHSGTGESTMFYARCTLPNLTTCIHSPYSYIPCVSEAKMAARSPPTPSPRVTATGVDSAGPIGRAQTGIGFHPRMGNGWAYLEVYTPRSQSSEKDLHTAPVTVRIWMVSEGVVM